MMFRLSSEAQGTYPPFWVANPSVALSETVAFVTGVGDSAWPGATSPAKA